jgi:cytoskeletal protein CcmA (bactofilin family)
MKRRPALLISLCILAGLALLGSINAAFTANPNRTVYFTDHFQLDSPLADSLVVVAESVRLRPGSRVEGDAAIVASQRVIIEGIVTGDLTVISPDVVLNAGAVVNGDLGSMGEQTSLDGLVGGDVVVTGRRLSLGANSQVAGSLQACPAQVRDVSGTFAAQLEACRAAHPDLSLFEPTLALQRGANLLTFNQTAAGFRFSPAGWAVTLAGAAWFIGFSMLAVNRFPLRFAHAQACLLQQPRRSLLAGLLTLGMALGMGGLLTLLTGVLPPLGLLIGSILAALFLLLNLFGWMLLALCLGEWLSYRLWRRYWQPIIEMGLGGLLLALSWHLCLFVPFGLPVALALGVLVGSFGLGAVLLTQIGGRSFSKTYFVQG